MKADLHNHSIYSDGQYTIEQLVSYAIEKEIDILAITDHDSINAINDIKKIKSNVKLLIGIELSTYSKGEDIHLLGYFYNNDASSKKLIEFLKESNQKRRSRVLEIISKLKKYFDIELTYDEIAAFADGTIGRPHVAWAIEKKYNIPFRECFDKFIGDACKAYVPTENLDIKDGIELLKSNNAFTVLAHPKQYKKNDVEYLIKLGVEGIEAIYPTHTKKDQKHYMKLAKKYNLVVTGGSDFHGINVVHDMGEVTLNDEQIKIVLSKLNLKEDIL